MADAAGRDRRAGCGAHARRRSHGTIGASPQRRSAARRLPRGRRRRRRALDAPTCQPRRAAARSRCPRSRPAGAVAPRSSLPRGSCGVLLLSLRLAERLALGAAAEAARHRRRSPTAGSTRSRSWRGSSTSAGPSGSSSRPRVDVPTVIGWLRPVVLMPASALAGLSPAAGRGHPRPRARAHPPPRLSRQPAADARRDAALLPSRRCGGCRAASAPSARTAATISRSACAAIPTRTRGARGSRGAARRRRRTWRWRPAAARCSSASGGCSARRPTPAARPGGPPGLRAVADHGRRRRRDRQRAASARRRMRLRVNDRHVGRAVMTTGEARPSHPVPMAELLGGVRSATRALGAGARNATRAFALGVRDARRALIGGAHGGRGGWMQTSSGRHHGARSPRDRGRCSRRPRCSARPTCHSCAAEATGAAAGARATAAPPVPPATPAGRRRRWAVVATARSSWSNERPEAGAAFDGEVEFTDDDMDVQRLSPGGSLRSRTGAGSAPVHGRVHADASGHIVRRYRVGNTEQPFDPEGRQWLSRDAAAVHPPDRHRRPAARRAHPRAGRPDRRPRRDLAHRGQLGQARLLQRAAEDGRSTRRPASGPGAGRPRD